MGDDGDGRRFRNLSGGLLMLVVAAAVVLPVLCCLGALVLGALTDGH